MTNKERRYATSKKFRRSRWSRLGYNGERTMPKDLHHFLADDEDILYSWKPLDLDTESDPYYPDIDDIALESGAIAYEHR